MKKIVIFASGSGSNFENIVNKLHMKECSVELLVCDRAGVGCLEKSERLGINTLNLMLKDYPSKNAYEQVILAKLQTIQPDLIVLAGYMKLISEDLLNAYEGKIINIHPSLLPAFPGANGIADAFNYGVKVMGITIHYVDAGIDTGQIIDQESFKLTEEDDMTTVTRKIHELEHRLYPEVICRLLK